MHNELKQKLLQMFILGYEGEYPSARTWELIQGGLGGIIFFAQNLKNRSDFKTLIKKFKSMAFTPLFLSMDQEGGLVERTIFLDTKNEYLTPKALSRLDNPEDVKKHYELLAMDLQDLGINMNFAPVLDVNTNLNNPIINVRSFGETAQEVSQYITPILEAFREKHIVTTGKHFAGHGSTEIDSHLEMPCALMEYDKFYKEHLACFEKAIKEGIDTIMVSHIHFPFFDEVTTPASLSPRVVDIYLKSILKFKGLVLSDDMVMGGISKHYGLKESIVLAIKAGIDIMIFKDTTQELIDCLDEVANMAVEDEELQVRINTAYEKIIEFKKDKLIEYCQIPLNIKENQQLIDKIARKTVAIRKKGETLPLKNKELTIVAFNHNEIYNLSYDECKFSNYVNYLDLKEFVYPLEPSEEIIKKISGAINEDEVVIFLSYNAHLHREQIDLFNAIKAKKILVSCALDCDIELFGDADSIVSLCCAKSPSLKALSNILFEN